MPELPEVETTRRGIAPHIEGRTVESMVIRQRSLRWPIPDALPDQIVGDQVMSVARRGKYLLLQFSRGVVLVHLGMSGSLRIVKADQAPAKHDHVDWLMGGDTILRFNDPRRFGSVLWHEVTPEAESVESHPLLASLGPEPLSEVFSADYLFQASRKRALPIKSLLMDSHVVVGVGNIYANEALFMSGVRPGRAAGRITRAESELLAASIKTILANAIQRGGTTLRDFVGGDGKPGYFAQELNVYGREGLACKQCGAILKGKKIAQRATVYCSHCQS